MEPGRFRERELPGLRREGAYVMIVVEEEREKNANRKGNEDPLDRKSPEMHKPRPVYGRHKCCGVWYPVQVSVGDAPREMGEARPPYRGNLERTYVSAFSQMRVGIR